MQVFVVSVGLQLSLSFLLHELLHQFVDMVYGIVAVAGKESIEAIDEMHEASDFVIIYRYVAACLIGDVDVVALLDEPSYCASHGNDVVIGVR